MPTTKELLAEQAADAAFAQRLAELRASMGVSIPPTTGGGAILALPGVLPIRVDAQDGVNARVLLSGPATLVGFQFFSLSQQPRYVRLYDMATVPDPTKSEPAIGPVPVEAMGSQFSPGELGLRFANGVAIVISGAPGSDDATPITKGDVNGYVGIR